MLTIPELWLGSQESFLRTVQNLKTYQANGPQYLQAEQVWKQDKIRARATASADEPEREPELEDLFADDMIQIKEGIGLVTISGSLVSQTSFADYWFGQTSYPTITTAINRLIEDSSVEQIVLVWDSPGGDAEGIQTLSDFIREADGVKPIRSWVGSKALSAAYWGAAATRKIHASDLGLTGSIGCVATFTSIARMLKDEGIDVHVIRSNPQKAPLHPAEPLSKTGEALLREQVDYLHEYFVSNIEQRRPALAERPRDEWAQGKTFYAKEAIALGLVDGPPISLGKLISKLNHGKTRTSNMGATMARQTILSAKAENTEISKEQAMAELGLAGCVPEQTDPPTEPVDPPAPEVKPEAKAEPIVAMTGDSEVVALLKEQLTGSQQAFLAAQTELATVKAQLAQAQTKLAETEASAGALRPVAEWAVARLQAALGQTPIAMSGLPATALAEQYSALQARFQAAFPIGRVSHAASTEDTPKSLAEARVTMGAVR